MGESVAMRSDSERAIYECLLMKVNNSLFFPQRLGVGGLMLGLLKKYVINKVLKWAYSKLDRWYQRNNDK